MASSSSSSSSYKSIVVKGCSRPNPFQPDNKKLWVRVVSFGGTWDHFTMDVQKLAIAGFYYTGTPADDSVQCAWCDLEMGGWKEVLADPFFVHVQLRPDCEFMMKCIRQLCHTYEPTIQHVLKSVEFPSELPIPYVPGTTVDEKKANSCLDIEKMCQLTDEFEDSSDLKCKVCLLRKCDTLVLPCSHLYTCRRCCIRLNKCPVCKEPIQATLRVFHG